MGSSVPSSATWIEPESTLAFLTVCLVHYYRIIHKRLPCGSWLQGSQAGRNCLPLCMHVCVCVRGQRCPAQNLDYVTFHIVLPACVCVMCECIDAASRCAGIGNNCALIIIEIAHVPSDALKSHWISHSISQSVTDSRIHSGSQSGKQFEQTNRIQTHSHHCFTACKYKKSSLGENFSFFLGSNDMYNLKVDLQDQIVCTYNKVFVQWKQKSVHKFDVTELLLRSKKKWMH